MFSNFVLLNVAPNRNSGDATTNIWSIINLCVGKYFLYAPPLMTTYQKADLSQPSACALQQSQCSPTPTASVTSQSQSSGTAPPPADTSSARAAAAAHGSPRRKQHPSLPASGATATRPRAQQEQPSNAALPASSSSDQRAQSSSTQLVSSELVTASSQQHEARGSLSNGYLDSVKQRLKQLGMNDDDLAQLDHLESDLNFFLKVWPRSRMHSIL